MIWDDQKCVCVPKNLIIVNPQTNPLGSGSNCPYTNECLGGLDAQCRCIY